MGKRFENTMILSDIDGTFLDDNSKMVQANLDAIRYYNENGGHFAFATGRIIPALDRPIPIWRELMSMPGIFSNGSQVYDCHADKILHERYMDARYTVDALVDIHRRYPTVKLRYTSDRETVHITDDFVPEDRYDKPCCRAVLESNDIELLADAREYIYKTHGDRYAYNKSCDIFFEFMRFDATKGTMLDWLRDYISAQVGPRVTAYAAGDFENDFEMLRHADVPACPDNGYPMIVDYCRENGLVLCDNNKGTIAALIAYLDDHTA